MLPLAALLAAATALGTCVVAWSPRTYSPLYPIDPTEMTTASSEEEPCHLPCTCVHLSHWAQRMRAHCRVAWRSPDAAGHPFQLGVSVDEVDFTDSEIHELRNQLMIGLQHIKVMRLEEVGLTSLVEDAFRGISELWSLSLARNYLAELPTGAFEGNRRLHHLSLRGNPLMAKRDRPLVVSETLQVLDVADCLITTLYGTTFQKLPSLRQLHLEGNKIAELPASAVSPLSKLSRLFLQSNNLLFFPSGALEVLPALLELRLDNNTSMEGPLGPVKAPLLQRLAAPNCSLQSLQPDLLQGAPELRYLQLASNQLRYLWLSGEPPAARLVLLDAAENPLECDCALRDSWEWARQHVDEAHVSCGWPPRPWGEANLQQLSCDQSTPMPSASSRGSAAGSAALWVLLSLLAVLAGVGGALLFVYRQQLAERFFNPAARAAATSGVDVMPLEESYDDATSVNDRTPEGGIAPWIGQ